MRHRFLPVLVAVAAACGGQSASTPIDPPSPAPPRPERPGWPVDAEGVVQSITTTATRVCFSSFAPDARKSLIACADKTSGKRTDLLRDGLVHPAVVAVRRDLLWSTEMTATIDRAPIDGGVVSPVVSKKGPHGRFRVVRQ